jgi:hypothetical protein
MAKVLRFKWSEGYMRHGYPICYQLRISGASIPFSRRVCGTVVAEAYRGKKPRVWIAAVYGSETVTRSPHKTTNNGLAFCEWGVPTPEIAKQLIERYWLEQLALLSVPVEEAK